MAALRFHSYQYALFIYLFLGIVGSSSGDALMNSGIQIDSSVKECLKIKLISKFVHNNIILLDAKLVPIKSTGYCGCKSAKLSYYALPPPYEASKKVKEYSTFSSLRHGNYTFILDRNSIPEKNNTYILNIQCASPD